MGAKSTVKGANAITPKLSFPVLMHVSSGAVVLFDSPTSGTCVAAGESTFMHFGQYLKGRDICEWTPFYGQVTLENE